MGRKPHQRGHGQYVAHRDHESQEFAQLANPGVAEHAAHHGDGDVGVEAVGRLGERAGLVSAHSSQYDQQQTQGEHGHDRADTGDPEGYRQRRTRRCAADLPEQQRREEHVVDEAVACAQEGVVGQTDAPQDGAGGDEGENR